MAEFCTECSIKVLGEDFRDLAGLSTPEDTAKGLFCEVICEGCGFVQVDHTGKCLGGQSCSEGHTYQHSTPPEHDRSNRQQDSPPGNPPQES